MNDRPAQGLLRLVATLGLVTGLLAMAGYTMWLQDWKWGLPTPRPEGLEQPAIGSAAALAAPLADVRAESPDKPLFLHFFNPDCPCSRFNEDHVRDLIRKHRDTTTFVAVIEPEGGPVNLDAVEIVAHKFGIRAVLDADGEIGRALGVYSTPQAVVVATDGRLYFRGNYNLARYCTDARTEFARLALEHTLSGAPSFAAPPQAVIAYGCPFPAPVGRLVQVAQ